MKGVHIRRAREEDLITLCGLLRKLFTIESGFEVDAGRQRRALDLMLQKEDALVLVAERNLKVVGMCSVQTVISTAQGGHVGLLEDLVVESDCRGLGIGSLLLDGACHWAWNKGLSRLQLLAECENDPAIRFYEKRGWTHTGFLCLRQMNECEDND